MAWRSIAAGDLAAGTSTGGLMNKHHGRMGDSPLIGAGTWADNASCAVSCTGHGEDFIRDAVARDIAAQVEYKGLSIDQASANVLAKLPKQSGGVIVLDRKGHSVTPFTTTGMFRATVSPDGAVSVKIFQNE